ncbi:hypothetical protein F5Y16DRAFT_402965 [Xylariaceae sp. FL0255]|nr:hypothetical protein F5Y16DRAFT_402965 [Xylariaceae sp. FL0255]
MATDSRKRALITGADHQIITELAQALLDQRWHVTIAVQPSVPMKAVSRPNWSEGSFSILKFDLCFESSVQRAAAKYGYSLDLLVNCGGNVLEPFYKGVVPWDQHTEVMLNRSFRINTIGPFLATKYFAPKLKETKGKVINLSSRSASIDKTFGGFLAYSASKTALNQMTAVVAAELKYDGIVVVSVDIGDLIHSQSDSGDNDDRRNNMYDLVRVINSIDLKKTGSFMDKTGNIIASPDL